MKLAKMVDIMRIEGDNSSEIRDRVVRERELSISVDGEQIETLSCSSENERELIIGYLYTEGLIENLTDIKSLDIADYEVNIRLDRKKKNNEDSKDIGRCNISFETVYELVELLVDNSSLFRETGGVHNALLAGEGKETVFREDIGRSNTVDKIVGYMLKNELKPEGRVLVLSCRVSKKIMERVIRMRIPVLVSNSAPTDRAIDLAQEKGVMLIGFARSQRMNIYTYWERLIWGN